MPARKIPRRELPERLPEVGVKVPLTAAEVRKLRERAAADLRSVAGYTAWLVARALERPSTSHRPVRGASPHARRAMHSINLRLPPSHAAALRKRADAELRSVSGYVARVIVEALARR